jgi:hypothetical protein
MDIRATICNYQAKMAGLQLMRAHKSYARKAASLLAYVEGLPVSERQYAADCYFGRCAGKNYNDIITELQGK